ncbi:MAG: MBL fold metallo-hydrolase [Devosia sp.]
MDDLDLAPPPKPILRYPFEGPPASGQSMEVAPGVRWIRMHLPYALDHINVWALEDGKSWAIVDTGVRTERTVATWRELFERSSDPRPIRRVFVTHMHPDHVGMAGWFARRPNTEVWMTRLEYLSCRAAVSDSGREAPRVALDFYRAAGWSEAALESYRARFGNFGTHIHALPDSYCRLRDGQELRIGGRLWRVVTGNGHSPEHACLYCPELRLFISGDQVLPRISSNVSVYPTEPAANPLADWLASLRKLREQVPDDVLVLPAHNECFHGLHARLDYLERSQLRVLQRLERALAEPRRVIDVFPTLFNRAIGEPDMTQLGLATGEAIACLNYLAFEGRVRREADGHGVVWYKRTRNS